MNTIGIILGDNDFGNTFIPLLKAVKEALLLDDELSESEIEELIRKGIPFFYFAYQNKYSEIGEYFDKVKVMFDDELAIFMQENDHDGGSWFLDVHSGAIESF